MESKYSDSKELSDSKGILDAKQSRETSPLRSEEKFRDDRHVFDSKSEDITSGLADLKLKQKSGTIEINQDPRALKIAKGFRINSISMKDAQTGRQIWQSSQWGDDMFEKETNEYIPKDILKCRSVAREISFSSLELMNQFRLIQRVYFHGRCIEEWKFKFGFVMPGSTNSWQQIIEAASPDKMMRPEELSGYITFETSFYDDSLFICSNVFRIFYV